MPLVSMTDMLNKALEGKYAVGQYNINNLEWTYAILEAAEQEKSPVILGVSEGDSLYGWIQHRRTHGKGLMEDLKVTVPVAIHLDHGSSVEKCKEAIDAGFTSVMIDDSHSPIDTNIATTKQVVEYAHAKGVSVEAEVGMVGGQEDDVIGDVMYAKLDDCVRIVNETGIDTLAPALGSVHGPYKGEPNLGFKEMEEIRNAVKLPLVLHGGTGIPTHDIKKAISLGTSKINVNTENQISFSKVVREVLVAKPEAYDPRTFLKPGREAIKETVVGKIREFGSNNQA